MTEIEPADTAERASTTDLRLFGGALGVLVSAGLGIVGSVTIAFGIVGLVGIPVGAIIGMAVGPRLARQTAVGGIVLLSTLAAIPLGAAMVVLTWSLSWGRGATVLEVLSVAVGLTPMVLLYSIIFGGPAAVLVAFITARLFKRNQDRAGRYRRASAAVIAIALVGLAGAQGLAVASASDWAAQQADQVPVVYRIDNQSSSTVSIQMRSYWHGQWSGGSDYPEIGPGLCAATGTDVLQGSDWAVWVSNGNATYVDHPSGDPLITSADYGPAGEIRLTIVIDPGGTAHLDRALSPDCPIS